MKILVKHRLKTSHNDSPNKHIFTNNQKYNAIFLINIYLSLFLNQTFQNSNKLIHFKAEVRMKNNKHPIIVILTQE